jgi:hypothetical protein
MNNLFRCLFLLTISHSLNITGQSLVPFEFKNAVREGTRTFEGIPGPLYYQNSTDYHINVNFNPNNGKLKAIADIQYFNNKPDTLRVIVMRLYQNILKAGTPSDFIIDPAYLSNGINITSLSVNGIDLTSELSKRTRTEGTLMTLYLPEPLIPGMSGKIQIGWNFIMPQTEVHRFGKYGPGTYFIAYWYPQIAVSDDIFGWDMIMHSGTQEFYNDFNDFQVNITLPDGYMVWSTGEWENAEDILSKEVQERYNLSKVSDEVIHIISNEDIMRKKVFLRKGQKTFVFKAEQIPDFAFAVSDRYIWDGTSAIIDTVNSIRVNVNAAYLPNTPNFELVAGMGAQVIRLFSNDYYSMPYPYRKVTVFQGEGGMEFPMIVNNGPSYSHDGTLFVTMHEIAHAYFPFLTGINETRYGWLDEGLTTFLPMRAELAMGSDYHTLEEVTRQYEMFAGTETDLALITPSWQTKEYTYYYLSYAKSVIAFAMLEQFMGEEQFRMGIKDFIKIWEYKHSTPYDFFNVMKRNSVYELDWFFNQAGPILKFMMLS